jgi:cell division protein ZapA
MADVRLSIVGREYIVTCRDGEETRLNELGQMVDSKAREAGGSAGGLSESRQLLFAALLLADQVKDGGGSSKPATPPAPAPGMSQESAEKIAQTLEKLADRLEKLAMGVEDRG